jgi:hypothetical protein
MVTTTALPDASPSIPSARPEGPGRGARRLGFLAAAVVGFGALIALLYTVSLHAFAATSDGATVVLEGQAMTAGHVLLHGWSLSLDSFWSVDALFYWVTELATGVRPMLLHFVPSIIAALVILVGALLARSGHSGPAAWAAALTVVTLLAFPSHTLAVFFLQGPLHVGTALWCLIAFAGLRSGRFGRGWVVAVVLLAAGALGDAQIIVLGMVPAFVAGLVAMGRTRQWRAGIPAVSAAVAALFLAGVLRKIAEAVGAFTVDTNHPRASSGQVVTNLKDLATWGANMLGVGHGTLGNGNVPAPFQVAHGVGLVVVVAAVATATVALVRGAVTGRTSAPDGAPWRLDDLLVVAFFADLGVFVVLTSSSDAGYLRYLTAAVIFGSILAGRWVGHLTGVIASVPLRRAGAVAGLTVIAACAAGLGFNVTAARPGQPFAQLDRFLESHQLHHGIGDYWSASITTVATAGVVTVRPVITTPTGKVVRYQRQSALTWYENQSFEFLVFNSAKPWGGVDSTTATATFGPVARTYAVGPYRVLLWPHPLSVSGRGFAPVPVPAKAHPRSS